MEEHRSLFDAASPLGLQRPSPRQRPAPPAAAGREEELVVNVIAAIDLLIAPDNSSDDRPTDDMYYRVTAYYPGEEWPVVEARKTKPVRAAFAASGSQACALYQQLRLPHDPREQLVRVALHAVSQAGELCIGEAVVPVADPDAEAESRWPLVRGWDDVGTLVLQLRPPGADSLLRDPVAAAKALPSESTGLPPDATPQTCRALPVVVQLPSAQPQFLEDNAAIFEALEPEGRRVGGPRERTAIRSAATASRPASFGSGCTAAAAGCLLQRLLCLDAKVSPPTPPGAPAAAVASGGGGGAATASIPAARAGCGRRTMGGGRGRVSGMRSTASCRRRSHG